MYAILAQAMFIYLNTLRLTQHTVWNLKHYYPVKVSSYKYEECEMWKIYEHRLGLLYSWLKSQQELTASIISIIIYSQAAQLTSQTS